MTEKDKTPWQEETHDDPIVDKANKMHWDHAAKVVETCEYSYITPSEKAEQACRSVEEIFKACTQELAILLPNSFRSTECLANLELASMWAKKSICVYDKEMSKKEGNNYGNQTNDS